MPELLEDRLRDHHQDALTSAPRPISSDRVMPISRVLIRSVVAAPKRPDELSHVCLVAEVLLQRWERNEPTADQYGLTASWNATPAIVTTAPVPIKRRPRPPRIASPQHSTVSPSRYTL